jgi:hypothetical protein
MCSGYREALLQKPITYNNRKMFTKIVTQMGGRKGGMEGQGGRGAEGGRDGIRKNMIISAIKLI